MTEPDTFSLSQRYLEIIQIKVRAMSLTMMIPTQPYFQAAIQPMATKEPILVH